MGETQSRKTGLYVIGLVNLGLIVLMIVAFHTGHVFPRERRADPETERAVAVALESRGLYEQAAEAYEHYLDVSPIEGEQRANVLYAVGNLYMDRLRDPAEALARYERIRTAYPDAKVASEVNRKIVTCLERLGQSLDAQNALDQSTRPGGAKKAGEGEVVLARIGEQEITDRDLADEIAALPPQVRTQIQGRAAKLDVLQSIVQRELMVGAAARRGLDKDPAVLAEIEQARKGILASHVLQQDVQDQIDILPAQVSGYIQDHPDEFKDADGKPLAADAAQRLAAQKVYQQEQRRLSAKLFESLMAAQNAEVFEDRVQ